MSGLLGQLDYVLAMTLVVLGLHGMLSRTHLVRKLVAMSIMQVGVIVFFLALADVQGGAPPLVGAEGPSRPLVNPLPHALMLTAIVVSVSTTGVALALLIHIHRRFGTLDETELLRRLRR
jgi:multicomponent Na+:H+ antiporter subunit C